MLTLTQDAELMTNIVSAAPVALGHRFVAIRDENNQPAVISLSSDNKLELIMQDSSGTNALYDLGAIWHVTGSISAFQAEQSSDLKVFIAFSQDTDTDVDESVLSLLPGLSPQSLLKYDSTIKLDSNKFPKICNIYLSNFGSYSILGHYFPLIIVTFQPPGKVLNQDLGAVTVSFDGSSAAITLDPDWHLRTNAATIVDVTFGSYGPFQGAFVLYTTNTQNHIQFTTWTAGTKKYFAVEPACPPGANSLTSYVDPDTQHSVLIVGGKDLISYKGDQYTTNGGEGDMVYPSISPTGVKHVHVVQMGTNLTFWFTNSADGGSYYSTSSANLPSGQLVPLLKDGTAANISGMISTVGSDKSVLLNTLVSVDQEAKLTVWQQSSDTQMWEPSPFFVPASQNNISVSSYTIRIAVKTDAPNDPAEIVKNSKLHIMSSGLIEAFVNGKQEYITSDGQWFTTDINGVMTLIVSTTDIACQTTKIDSFLNDEGQKPLTPLLIDPSAKAQQKLESIQDGQSLKNAKTKRLGKDGQPEPLITPGSVDDKTLDQAAGAIKALSSTRTTLGFKKPTTNKPHLGGVLKHLQGQTPRIYGNPPKKSEALNDFLSLSDGFSSWGIFQWLNEMVDEVDNWVVSIYDSVTTFVVKWAGKAYTFLLDTVATIGKAFSWVFNKILVGIEKLIDFLGFLFQWDDIVETMQGFSAVITGGAQYSADQIGVLQQNAHAYFDKIRQAFKDPPELRNFDIGTNAQPPIGPYDSGQEKDIRNGAAYNWGSYQMQHGGFKDHSKVVPSTGTRMENLGDDDSMIVEVWNAVKDEAEKIGKLFADTIALIEASIDGSTSSDSVRQKLQNKLVDDALDCIQTLIDDLLKAVAVVLNKLAEAGNQAIDVPIFTALWNWLIPDAPFTILNLCSLLLAIPSTVLYKLVKGVAPPSLKDFTKEDLGKWISGTLPADRTEELNILTTLGEVSAVLVAMDIGLISFVVDQVSIPMTSERSSGERNLTSVSPFAGNVIDVVSGIVGVAGLVFTYPPWKAEDKGLHWGVWGLDCSNVVCLILSRLYGGIMGVPRKITKNFLGWYEMATGTAIFILEDIISSKEWDRPDSDHSLIILEGSSNGFQFLSCIAFTVAATADAGDQEEVAAPAIVIWGFMKALSTLFTGLGVFIEYGKKETQLIDDKKRKEGVTVIEKTPSVAIIEKEIVPQ